MDTMQVRDRVRGAVVGTAVGDALGAPFEGHRTVDPAALRRWSRGEESLRWTDDTAMTISVAESLAACGGFDGADMAARFVARYDVEPWRGYGGGPPQVFDAIRRGAPWHLPAARLFGGRGSFGNGAAMRVAPVGVFVDGDLREVAEAARATAGITHTHELARQGAAIQACAVRWLASAGLAGGSWTPADLIGDLSTIASAPEYEEALARVAAMANDQDLQDDRSARQRTVAELGNGIAAVEAVPAALHSLLRHPASFADTVTEAVGLGGDTDTIAAMAGALSGALLGHASIPASWLARLEAQDQLLAIADRLFDASRPSAPPGGIR